MADSWGGSWLSTWGTSWTADDTPPTLPAWLGGDLKALTYVEIDVGYCSLTFGTAPCTATLSGSPVTGRIKCFNTRATCQDIANFADDPVTLRFAKPADYLPVDDIEAIASIESISFSPGMISLGESLGQRASLTVVFQDHRHSDTGTGYDKYLADRSYDPFSRGTYWGKFRNRHYYLRGKPLRLIQGLLGDAIADMDTRHFVIESFEGPSLDGKFTITAKDALKLADGDRAQAPALSKGYLAAGIASGATSAALSPTGIGNSSYAASGYLNIGGKEIVSFTRSGDTLTLTRAQYNTTAVAHEAGDRCQICLRYSAADPADIAYGLLTTYAGIDTDYITLADWQAETEAYSRRVFTTLIAEPTSVNTLLSELIEQVGMAIWWDDLNQQIRLQVLRAISTDAETFDNSNIVEGSFRVKEQPNKRISQVWTFFGILNPLKGLEPDNFRSSVLTVDSDEETNFGSSAIKKIYSRWIPFGGLTTAERVNDIQLGRYRIAPRHVAFRLFRRGAETPELGEGCRIEALPLQDATGDYDSVPIQITRLLPGDDYYDVEAEESLFTDLDSSGSATSHPITIDSSENGINLRTLHDTLYSSVAAGDTVTCIINSSAVLGAASSSGVGFNVGSWPSVPATGNRTSGSAVISGLSINTTTEGLTAGMFVRGTGITNGTKILSVDSTTQITLDANATSTGTGGALTFYTVMITVKVMGRVQGPGGTGGNGASYNPTTNPTAGSAGGTAFYTRYPIDLILNEGFGRIYGGGGGGGGADILNLDNHRGGGGGGGAGIPGGYRGGGPGAAQDGSDGTTNAGGLGGRSWASYSWSQAPYLTGIRGGTGGTPGVAGNTGEDHGGSSSEQSPGAGGAAGKAIDGVSYCKKTGTGSILGGEAN